MTCFFFWMDSSRTEMSTEKTTFLQTYPRYGYDGKIDHLRETNFTRLKETIYLDHAGSTLYTEDQMRCVTNDYLSNTYGNPHSLNPSSSYTATKIQEVRNEILSFFGTSSKHHTIIFTSGATASLKIIGECFPWKPTSQFLYLEENHNSVIGIRELAPSEEQSRSITLDEIKKKFESEDLDHRDGSDVENLIAIPAENNFSGEKFPLHLLPKMRTRRKDGQWNVLLDGAAYVATSPLNLGEISPDFLTLSFYKMFGFPTGIGALILRNEKSKILHKKYFGGGTVGMSLSKERGHVFRNEISMKFEDGTVSFLSIAALRHGFQVLNGLGMKNIQTHTHSLTEYLISKLKQLKYPNGQEAVVLYLNSSTFKLNEQGPIVAFNLKDSHGKYIGFNEVDQMASLNNIHLRVGCFCNPGACARWLKLTSAEIRRNFEAGHVCWDSKDIMSGKPVGAVRVSLGFSSTFEDIEIFLKFLESNFIQLEHFNLKTPPAGEQVGTFLEKIFLYPIKSLGKFQVENWEISSQGLMWDREWALIDSQGNYLNQKKVFQVEIKLKISDDGRSFSLHRYRTQCS
eukprot:TRINITY_DN5601_c0_g4_i2.p1 TRINITY_DN5601_c0_g4~~TRINITY_DN5601_c0_g4_i2.p1  ORF type:complete len:570 (-),score=187.91 TRINITY_DN5601_c0_g4_i2:640-2349(-)